MPHTHSLCTASLLASLAPQGARPGAWALPRVSGAESGDGTALAARRNAARMRMRPRYA
eukprot:CAMPEP_0115880116 /NCGR_PEP_ID=MMETSP0287-20121206/27698_1 /TAXON_ID=412157 /ORGANISM="Chrysochromulina rotalis, Strain UIO044" /LENGTH=58 /DNA_ID=CAMNT_0003335903 /DNA_START=176 /DNA_END=349 /DNA_ORIENTATION=-